MGAVVLGEPTARWLSFCGEQKLILVCALRPESECGSSSKDSWTLPALIMGRASQCLDLMPSSHGFKSLVMKVGICHRCGVSLKGKPYCVRTGRM